MGITRRAGEYRKRRLQEVAFLLALAACASLILAPILKRQAQERAEQQARAEALFNEARDYAGMIKRIAPPAAGFAYRAACGAPVDELIERMAPIELESLNGRLDKDPDNVELLLERAGLYATMGRNQDQLDDLTRVLSLQPDNLRALELRANELAYDGQYREAQHDLETMARISGDDFCDYYLQAYVDVGLGKNREAIELYDHLACVGDDPEVFWGRAMARRALGDENGAWQDVRRARELEPGYCMHWRNGPVGDPGVHEEPCARPTRHR